MDAPLLDALRRRAASTRSEREAGCLKAEIGIYLARTGQLDEARELVNQIRQRWGQGQDPEVFGWVAVLEALIGYYTTATVHDKPRLQRAHAVAEAARRPALQHVAAAWLAHHCFNACEYQEMGTWLVASGLHRAEHPSAVIRACLTTADAFQALDDGVSAAAWYTVARQAASAAGDRASLMASIENRAALRLGVLCLQSMDAPATAESLAMVESELLGGLGYERLTRSDALRYQASLWRAKLESLKGNHALALSFVVDSRDTLSGVAHSQAQAHDADVAWLLLQVGRVAEAQERFEWARRAPADRLHPDDAALYWRRMAELDRRLFDGLLAEEFEQRSRAALNAHWRAMDNLAEALAALPPPPTPSSAAPTQAVPARGEPAAPTPRPFGGRLPNPRWTAECPTPSPPPPASPS